MRTRAQIVEELEREGLVFRTFVVEHDSDFGADDWDWNQRDLAHVPFIHGGFRFVAAAVGDDRAAGLYWQRAFGVRVPLAVSFHHDSPTSRVYFTTLGPAALVIGAEILGGDGDGGERARARIRTTYSLGIARVLRWVLPAAEWWLRRNYAQLDREDSPMRARRRELRGWGYRFVADEKGASYERSLDLKRDGVLAPAVVTNDAANNEVLISADFEKALIGRNDHLGLKVVRDGDVLRIYPRMCLHEGASLDSCEAERGVALTCPWHGRRILPVAEFALNGSRQEAVVGERKIVFEGGRLAVVVVGASARVP